MNYNGLVVLYLRDGKNPAGSDYTILSDLKTLRGVRNRYKEHMRNMIKRGCTEYIVVPRIVWYNEEIDYIIKHYTHHKLEVQNNE